MKTCLILNRSLTYIYIILTLIDKFYMLLRPYSIDSTK